MERWLDGAGKGGMLKEVYLPCLRAMDWGRRRRVRRSDCFICFVVAFLIVWMDGFVMS
jgi:hypothetical protein